MATIQPRRDGWIIEHEKAPSLCRHFLPTGFGHVLSNVCWCKPAIQNEPFLNPPYTMVHHNEVAAA